MIFHRPANPDVCDVCGGALISRDDDNPAAVAKRLADYHSKTKPILEVFSRKELVVTVDGSKPVPDVQAEIRQKLNLNKPITPR